MNPMDYLAAKAQKINPIIVFPEGEDPQIQEAAKRLEQQGLARPVLLGAGDPAGLQPDMFVDPPASPLLPGYVEKYCQEREMPQSVGQRIVTQPLCFAAMMVKCGDASGMVAGIANPTEDVIMASELIIGLKPGIALASSFYLMEVPGFTGGEAGLLVLADPAVNPDPSAEELADIAISSAQSIQQLLGWEPRVAMLSFSTKGSASHPLVDKVIKATELAREREPELAIDGELQVDSALFEEVARKKITGDSKVAGKANVLIFPDLNSANIGSKLIQGLAGATAYGPVLQGFDLPVSDLSRGAKVEDIVGAALMVAGRISQ